MVFYFTYWMVKAPPGLRSLRTLFDRVAYACLRRTNGSAHGDGGQRAAGSAGGREKRVQVAARKP